MPKMLYTVENELSRLKFFNKEGQEEDVSIFFSRHFKNLFPRLKLFLFKEKKNETEYWYNDNKGNKGEFDAICWYPEKETFVVFEYKVSKDKLLDQIYKYLNAIEKEKYGKIKHDLVKILNEKYPKIRGWWSIEDINWDQFKIVCLATEFYEWQNSVSVRDERIVWGRTEWYGNNDNEKIIILKSEEKDFLFLEEISENTTIVTSNEDKFSDLTQLFDKIKPHEENKEKIQEIHKILTEKGSLVHKTYFHEGSGWKGIDYNIKGSIKDFSFFWINISKKAFRIYFPRSRSDKDETFLVDFSKQNGLEEKSTVFILIVENENDFSRALFIIEKFLEKKLKQTV